jgi:hypothetical protein
MNTNDTNIEELNISEIDQSGKKVISESLDKLDEAFKTLQIDVNVLKNEYPGNEKLSNDLDTTKMWYKFIKLVILEKVLN